MNRKDMWQIAKGIKAGCSVAEYAWGFNIMDIENDADVQSLLALGWQGNKSEMEYRDGLYLYGEELGEPIPEDPKLTASIQKMQEAYDRLDERLD